MPQVHEILKSLHGAAIFSTLDLRNGYCQVEMRPESISETAHVTKNNQFEFLCFLLLLKNIAATFQKLMNTILAGVISKCCFVYIDDTVVYTRDVNIHFFHLQQVFSFLKTAELTLNLEVQLSSAVTVVFRPCDI